MSNKRVRKVNHGITEGSLRASIWKLAVPMMIGALLQDLFTLADLFFVGRLGSLFLILSPRIFAHSFYNSKDLAFLSFFIISIYTMVRYLEEKTLASIFSTPLPAAY